MSHLKRGNRRALLTAAVAGLAAIGTADLGSGSSALGAGYTWTGATTGSTNGANWYWDNAANWGGGGFPSAAGDVANLNVDVTGGLAVRLNAQGVTLGTLNLGDSAASGNNYSTTIQSNNATYGLTFMSAAAGGMTYLNLTASGATPANTISSNITVGGTSGLTMSFGTNAASVQRLTTTGTFDTNGNTVTLTGGVTSVVGWTLNGDLKGDGTIVQNNVGGMAVGAATSFTGTLVLNAPGPGVSNSGSLTVTGNSSIKDATDVVINGYITRSSNAIVQHGGTLWSGNNSAAATKPGQRFTQNTITLNGGNLQDGGQASNGSWSGAIQNSVNIINFNSSHNYVTVNTNTNGNATAGTILDANAVQRHNNATVFVQNAALGGTSQFLADNGATLLVGSGGVAGTTSMSIIPWMGAATNTYTVTPDSFATYESGTGFRALTSSEMATSITAGATTNVDVSSFGALASDTTVNSLRFKGNLNNSANIGTGKTLTITSGGLIFTTNGNIGKPGDAAAGTLNFGSAEGVVWTTYDNSNTIGAVITGSGGLTKTGIGTLVLAGANTFTGKTYVANSILQIGNGTQTSNLGVTGDVAVAPGALLKLLNGGAIADSATLSLEQAGLFNGMTFIDTGINETVGGLTLAGLSQIAGTYGSMSSAATFKNDTYFSGTGILTVVPEPASLSLLALGGLAMLRRRRMA